MPEDDLPALSPQEISGADFPTRRRGYDPAAVDSHLRLVATSMGEQQTVNRRLRTELAELERTIDELKQELQSARSYDEDVLVERLGETASVRLEEAQVEADALLAAARTEADELLTAANEAHAQRTTEAEEHAESLRAERLGEIEAEIETRRQASESVSKEAADEAERVVREAQIFRRQILEDLSRRRGQARRQIEQLRAGRERLIASHDIMRRALDGIGQELNISMSEARLAAETAGHGVAEDSVDDLEAEIETARLSGILAPDVSVVGEVEDEADEADDDPAVGGDVTDAALEAEVGDSGALASVVALSSARDDVETGSHPSSGRDSSSRSQKPYDEADEHDEADEDLVEDLFARMRSTRATKDAGDSEDDTPTIEDLDAFIEELARQLKRVLAEEQTELLTILRSDAEVTELDELLGERDDHRRRYHGPAMSAADEVRTLWNKNPETGDLVIEANINELVESLRRGVSRCIAADDQDVDSIVEDLGAIYREVKTERILGHATTVCEAAADLGSRGNLSSV